MPGSLRGMQLTRSPWIVSGLALAAALTGCGGSSQPAGSTGSPSASAPGHSSAGALASDANSAATGDIPDKQAFLVFRNRAARYSIKYPEGWTQSGTANNVTFRDKDNVVRLIVAAGPTPTPASVSAQLTALKRTDPTLTSRAPAQVSVGRLSAVRASYETKGSPDPVTGRRATLVVDRYELARGGRVVTVDLGTPAGVDNVDAYRMMIQSFRWL